MKKIILAGFLFAGFTAAVQGAPDDDSRPPEARVENDYIVFYLIPRTPEPMAAFYEGRGFPVAAVEEVKRHCFITAGMRNTGQTVLWLEPRYWRFWDATGREIKRLDRNYWKRRWQALDLPAAQRATFGWTLLPESRDLQPDEPVGGNIVLPATEGPMTIQVRFRTGRDKRGPDLVLEFEGIRCPRS